MQSNCTVIRLHNPNNSPPIAPHAGFKYMLPGCVTDRIYGVGAYVNGLNSNIWRKPYTITLHLRSLLEIWL